jgi:hypothetical protein
LVTCVPQQGLPAGQPPPPSRVLDVNPAEGYAYLSEVADELARLEREVMTSRTECERMKQGLRKWQALRVGCRGPPDVAGRQWVGR